MTTKRVVVFAVGSALLAAASFAVAALTADDPFFEMVLYPLGD